MNLIKAFPNEAARLGRLEFPEAGTEATTIRDPLVGAKVLGYEIVRPIGVGGMGKVYEAIERNIGRRAAIKVLLPEAAERPDFVARLKAEARAANAARHRGIVDIFGFAELPDGRHAIVMEYLEGIPLDEELHRLAAEGRRLPTLQVLQVLDELAAVLTAAHVAGVIHRDLKPSNVFLVKDSEGASSIKVLDFGIAKHDVKTSLKTATNMVLGTPHYMAPEQAAAAPAAPSMDLYSFGVIAFELFTGRLPFLQENIMSLLLAHQQEAPPTPSSINPSLPQVVDAFVLKLLAKRPEDRFGSAREIRAELTPLRRVMGDSDAMRTDPELAPGVKNALPPVATPTRIISDRGQTAAIEKQGVERSPWPMVGAAVGALALVVLGVWATRSSPDLPAERSLPPAPVVTPAPVAAPDPPAQPTAVPEPVAPPVPTAEPQPEPRPAKAQPVDRRATMSRRIKTLEARLARAEASGASVSLERQQVQALQAALKRSPDGKKLDQIEVAIQRLEGDFK